MLERIRKNDWVNDVVWLQVLDENNWGEQYEKKANAFFESTQKAPPKNTQNLLKYWAAAYFQYNQLIKSNFLANIKTIDASYQKSALYGSFAVCGSRIIQGDILYAKSITLTRRCR
jgi:hypothetical protein